MLAASRVAHFGAGMLAGDAGLAALAGWARAVAGRIDGFYIAFDLDALDASGDWALAMAEPGGLARDRSQLDPDDRGDEPGRRVRGDGRAVRSRW